MDPITQSDFNTGSSIGAGEPTRTPGVTGTSAKVEQLTERAVGSAERALRSTRQAADNTFDALQGRVETMRDTVPAAVSRATANVEQLAQRSIDRARAASADLQHRAEVLTERTSGYVREQPMRSIAIAAASGAALMAVLGFLSSMHGSRR